jgi:hypothetical protein
MANPPKSNLYMDGVYEKRCREFTAAAATDAANLAVGGPTTWFRPEGWDGEVSGPDYLKNMSVPFTRAYIGDDYVRAVQDVNNPGTCGDIVAATIMTETLSVMERALRARHTLRRVRATCHVVGRKQAHGSDTGPFIQSNVEFMRNLLARAKGSTT